MRWRSVFLIARREFLAYTLTVGFWLSVAFVPIFMALGATMPALLQSAKPASHFALIDETGRYADIVRAAVTDARRTEVREAVEAYANTRLDSQQRGEALALFDQSASDPDQAAADTMAAFASGKAALDLPRAQLIERDVHGQDLDRLRRMMQSEPSTNAPPLNAVLVIKPDGDGAALDYWSANLADRRLVDIAEDAVAAQMRIEALRRAGLDVRIVSEADSVRPVTRLFSPVKSAGAEEVTRRDEIRYAAGAMLAFLLWMLVFSVANMLLSSVLEEKTTKVMESLLVSARMSEILAGKLLGVGGVAFALLAVWAASTIGLGALVSGHTDGFADIFAAFADPKMLIAFAACFVAGYLMYGATFLALGSLCDSTQEAQTLMSPVILLLMAPMLGIVAALDDPNSAFVTTLAWAPIFTPFLMLARLPSDPPLWEIIAAVVLMVGTALLILFLAARIFRAGALGGGKQFWEHNAIGRIFARRVRKS
ncbi:MAG: ABC transporter permease [Caulobacterales bacterium]